jgi:serine/threonine-protein kinase
MFVLDVEGDREAMQQHLTEAMMILPTVGDIIANKYELVRTLGEGGMGVVFEAVHLKLQQRLAIKVLNPKQDLLAEAIVRFEREARAVARLDGVHVAKVIDVDSLPSGLPYIVLEYLVGHDLGVELAKAGPLPIDVAVDYAMQVASALSEAHASGVIHRDIKPANLFLCDLAISGRKLVKLLDFGVAKIVGERDEKVTGLNGCVGTPEYMAPEQLREASEADGRADVWSLGVVLYELLTGRTPFKGSLLNVVAGIAADPVPDPRRFRPGLSAELVDVVLGMLEKEPTRRIETMQKVVEALAPFGPAERVSDAIAAVPRAGRIGDILVANGFVTSSQLEAALDHQQKTGTRLGRALVDLGFLEAADLMAALAKQESATNTFAPPPPPPPAAFTAPTRRIAPTTTRSVRARAGLAVAAFIALVVLGAAAVRSSGPSPRVDPAAPDATAP